MLERFPECSEQITRLSLQDADFAEMCAEYEELARWMAAHCGDDRAREAECAANQLLLAEMEVEILQKLHAAERQSGR